MTATSVSYPHASERVAARLGRALLSWADTHASKPRAPRERRVWTHEADVARAERERADLLRMYLHG